ncbi:MAG: ATP-binding cassette domain-containing protein [SAR324 cluster bacterium]|nr:ATP-binding cassette domain-containing protein [SAR324 cluster bacterium]MBL7034100.1 ATP-binding cassette domain-containing protein [SAR324 cluster bacterium]
MISITDLAMNYGKKTLFEKTSVTLDPGKSYGLVGANGAGKSTLLRLITGEERPSSGTINVPRGLTLGVLRQDHFQFENFRVIDVVLQGKPALCKALSEKEKILATEKMDSETGHRLGQLEEIIAEEDGYVAESFAAELLSGLGIAEHFHSGPMNALSGGFKLRVLLAQLLFQKSDVMLLDEPTNHLDIVSIRWLENYLCTQFDGTLVFISHDRNFLNAVAGYIVDIDYEEIRLYTGNYEQFLEAKILAETQKLKEIESYERKTAELQAFVDRFRAKATKARQAQSRVKQLDKMDVPEVKRSSRISPDLRFVQTRPSGRTVLTVKNVNKKFADTEVLKNISFEIQRGEKVAIIGPNGIGKSTLLKIILAQLAADSGTHDWGYETHTSYFAQDHHEQLSGKISAYDWLYATAPHEPIGAIRGLLGRVLLSGDEALKQVSALSGGESARLLFARIMLEKRNVLILDEPTNHMDLEGVAALGDALREFEGTVLVVSHYRHFVSKVATRILELTPDGVRDFSGSYQEYLENFGDDYLNRNLPISTTRQQTKAEPVTIEDLSYNERKELQREISKLKKQLTRFETQVEETEKNISEIEKIFGANDYYQQATPEQVYELQSEKTELGDKLTQYLKQWEISTKNLEIAEARFNG